VGVPGGAWTSNTTFQLLSDNGTSVYYNDGIEAKHHPIREFKKFRADTVALGSVLPNTPIVRALQRNAAGDLTVTWLAQPGSRYRVQCNSTLNPASWRDLNGEVTATGPAATKTFTAGDGARCFYRVIVVE
jgi:hypothetical protein